MINLIANKQLKAMGCKWSGQEWIAPALAEKEVQAIKDKYYSKLVTILVVVKKGLEGEDFGYSHARLVGGYIVATASGRDSGARVAEGVAFTKGSAKSGGSMKNFICSIDEGVHIKLRVSKNILADMDNEVSENRYSYEILDEITLDSLLETKKELLKKLQNIEIEINKIRIKNERNN